MAKKSGLPWHKRQLSVFRSILTEAHTANDPTIRNNLGQQFIGACRSIAGTTIPAYHKPLLHAVMDGKMLFLNSQNDHVETALGQIMRERRRVVQKTRRKASQATIPTGTETGGEPSKAPAVVSDGSGLSSDIGRECAPSNHARS